MGCSYCGTPKKTDDCADMGCSYYRTPKKTYDCAGVYPHVYAEDRLAPCRDDTTRQSHDFNLTQDLKTAEQDSGNDSGRNPGSAFGSKDSTGSSRVRAASSDRAAAGQLSQKHQVTLKSCLRKVQVEGSPSLLDAGNKQAVPAKCHSYELFICGLSGEICTLVVEGSSSWTDVKEAIQSKTGISAAEQRLLLGEREVLDDQMVGIAETMQLCVTLLRRPPEVVKWIDRVTDDWMSLEFAPDAIKQNREVVVCAVREHGCAIQFASEDLRADFELLSMATRACGNSIGYARSFEPHQMKALQILASTASRCLPADDISDRS